MRKSFIALWTVSVLFAGLLFSGSAFAFHPLITDDTGTQGKKKFQLEVNGQFAHDSTNGVKTDQTDINTTLTYGLSDTLDISVGMPYSFIREKDSTSTVSNDGISDVGLDLKWRFYEKDGWSLSVKPGLTLPTGDDEKGLGQGRTTYHMFLITTKEIKPWAFHLNLGYIRNENKVDEDKDIWHASFATEVEVAHHLKVVANIGAEKNPDRTSSTNPAFILGGFVYSITDNFDFDLGIKGGLNKAEPDYMVLAGITVKF